MRSFIPGETDGLVGYWPLNDGLGLRVADVSTHKLFGSLRTCQWQDEKRPFEHPRQRHVPSAAATIPAAAAVAATAVAAVGAATAGATTAGAKDATPAAAKGATNLVPYDFSHQALPQTLCYANGECVAIIYPAVSLTFFADLFLC
jgi:hypothetical protein